ncbi:unnamed protein product [Malus baccata var. baccata]
MSGPSDRRFDLNLGKKTVPPSPDNIWRPSFISLTGPLTVRDSMMKNDMTAAVVARNLVTPKDNRLLSKRSDELAVKDSLALRFSVQRFVGLFQQHLPSSSRDVPCNEALNDQPSVPPPPGVPPSDEVLNSQPPAPLLPGASPNVSAHAGNELWCRLLCSCRPGALVSLFMLMRIRSAGVAFYARADQELWLSPFRLVWTMSVGIAFYAHADQER